MLGPSATPPGEQFGHLKRAEKRTKCTAKKAREFGLAGRTIWCREKWSAPIAVWCWGKRLSGTASLLAFLARLARAAMKPIAPRGQKGAGTAVTVERGFPAPVARGM